MNITKILEYVKTEDSRQKEQQVKKSVKKVRVKAAKIAFSLYRMTFWRALFTGQRNILVSI